MVHLRPEGGEKNSMKILMTIVIIFLVGCFHENNSENDGVSCDNDELDFSGCWVTQVCKQADDGDGNLIDRWHKSQYNFKADNSLEIKVVEYEDSSCSSNGNISPISGEAPTIEYEVIDEIMLEEGVPASQVKITMSFSDSVVEVNGGLVVTENKELCSSKSFYFGAGEFKIAASGLAKDTELFENCLSRGKLP